MNQVEIHPYLVQKDLVRFCQMHNIAVTGYSPLGAGSYVSLGGATEDESVLKNAVVAGVAEEVSRHKTDRAVIMPLCGNSLT